MGCLSAPSGIPGSPPARHKEVGRSIRRWPAPTRSHHHAQLVHRQTSWRTGRACMGGLLCPLRILAGLVAALGWPLALARLGSHLPSGSTSDRRPRQPPLPYCEQPPGGRAQGAIAVTHRSRAESVWALATRVAPLICLLPLPHFCLRTRGRCTLSVPNVATTALSLSISSGKAAVPVASPPHPSNRQPKSAVAVIVTSVSTT